MRLCGVKRCPTLSEEEEEDEEEEEEEVYVMATLVVEFSRFQVEPGVHWRPSLTKPMIAELSEKKKCSPSH